MVTDILEAKKHQAICSCHVDLTVTIFSHELSYIHVTVPATEQKLLTLLMWKAEYYRLFSAKPLPELAVAQFIDAYMGH